MLSTEGKLVVAYEKALVAAEKVASNEGNSVVAYEKVVVAYGKSLVAAGKVLSNDENSVIAYEKPVVAVGKSLIAYGKAVSNEGTGVAEYLPVIEKALSVTDEKPPHTLYIHHSNMIFGYI